MKYDENNKIVLFKNDKKGNDKAPEYKGSTTINNTKYKVAVWIRNDKNGKPYMSGIVEEEKKEVTDPFEDFSKSLDEVELDDPDLPF